MAAVVMLLKLHREGGEVGRRGGMGCQLLKLHRERGGRGGGREGRDAILFYPWPIYQVHKTMEFPWLLVYIIMC